MSGDATVPRARVLVVDDDPLSLKAMERILARDSDVVATLSARRVLEILETGARFDVVLSDLVMPEMSGRELYEEMCRRFPAQATRMVFVTGGAINEELETFLTSIPNEPVEKPVKIATLDALIAEYKTRGGPPP